MKKFLPIVAVVMVLISVAAIFVGCSSSSAQTTVTKYEIESTKVNVGDAFVKPTITAYLSDGTTKTVSNNLIYKQADLDALELDDNKFTKAGEYTVHVYLLEEKEGYELGAWSLTVKATK
ncbi:MAG: hypothetical protein IJ735_06925 [Clostridia bacterium]|nr:hypothetical protein [Clostridia bacterium]